MSERERYKARINQTQSFNHITLTLRNTYRHVNDKCLAHRKDGDEILFIMKSSLRKLLY